MSTPTVLVVEDDRQLRRMLREVIEEAGMHCLEAEDGLQAVQFAAEKNPQVMLLDIHLPVMGGLEVLQKIKKEGVRLKCIMISGSDEPRDIVTYMREGACDFLRKPFNSTEIVNAVRRALSFGVTIINHEDAEGKIRDCEERLRETKAEYESLKAVVESQTLKIERLEKRNRESDNLWKKLVVRCIAVGVGLFSIVALSKLGVIKEGNTMLYLGGAIALTVLLPIERITQIKWLGASAKIGSDKENENH